MSEETRIVWLKRVLVAKIVVTVLLWGLPQWIVPVSVLAPYGNVPDPPFYMRIAGGNSMALAFLFWLALKDPARNRDVIRYAVVDNLVSFATVAGYGWSLGIENPMVWVSAVLVLFFAIAFYVLIPNTVREPALRTA